MTATCKPSVACRANAIAVVVAVVATLVAAILLVVAAVDFICGSLLGARCIFKALRFDGRTLDFHNFRFLGSRSVRLACFGHHSCYCCCCCFSCFLVLANGQFGSFKCCAMQPRRLQRILLLKAAVKGGGARGGTSRNCMPRRGGNYCLGIKKHSPIINLQV